MEVAFDASVTAQQRRWAEEAIARCTYPLDSLDVVVTFVTAAEPPAPGHKDYMCVEGAAGVFTVTMRVGADDPQSDFNRWIPNTPQNIRTFFMESVVHELMHVVAMEHLTDDALKTTVAEAFYRRMSGEGLATGTLADWNPLDQPWEDRIQEAFAEVLKDTFLADGHRVFDNRTNWGMYQESFEAVVAIVLPPVGDEEIAVEAARDFWRGPMYYLDASPANPENPWTGRGSDRVSFSYIFSSADPALVNSLGWGSGTVQTALDRPLFLEMEYLEFPAGRLFTDAGPGPQAPSSTGRAEPFECYVSLWEYDMYTSDDVWLAQVDWETVRDGNNLKFRSQVWTNRPMQFTVDPPLPNGVHVGTYPPAVMSGMRFALPELPADDSKLYEVSVDLVLMQGLTDEPYSDFWFWDKTVLDNPHVPTGWRGSPTNKLAMRLYGPGFEVDIPAWPYPAPSIGHGAGGTSFMRLG